MLSVREDVLVVATYILNPRIVDCVDTWLNLAEVCLIAVAYESEVCEVEHIRTKYNLVSVSRSLSYDILEWSHPTWVTVLTVCGYCLELRSEDILQSEDVVDVERLCWRNDSEVLNSAVLLLICIVDSEALCCVEHVVSVCELAYSVACSLLEIWSVDEDVLLPCQIDIVLVREVVGKSLSREADSVVVHLET